LKKSRSVNCANVGAMHGTHIRTAHHSEFFVICLVGIFAPKQMLRRTWLYPAIIGTTKKLFFLYQSFAITQDRSILNLSKEFRYAVFKTTRPAGKTICPQAQGLL